MIALLDLNVLLAAMLAEHPHHRVARDWMERAPSKGIRFAFAWQVLIGFARISTNTRLFQYALAPEQAIDTLLALTQLPGARILTPDHSHFSVLRALLGDGQLRGDILNDAHLAALAMEHGARVVSFDRDFLRFKQLRLDLLSA